MRYLVVINEMAGPKRKRLMVRGMLRALNEAGHDVRVVRTERRTAEPISRAVDRYRPERCVVAGGDGTIRDTVQCLWEAGRRAPVAVMPVGTANFLAKVLGLPGDPRGAIPVALGRRTRPLHVGLVNRRHVFLVAVGLGLDAAILRTASRARRAGWGLPGYWWAGARRLLRERPFTVAIRMDGRRLQRRCRSLFVVNQMQFTGLGLLSDRPTGGGRLEVGLFDIFTGLRATDRGVRFNTQAARCVEIEAVSRPVPFQMDGDVTSLAVRRIETAEQTMPFLVPS